MPSLQARAAAHPDNCERYTLRILAGLFHGWQMCYGLVPEASESLREAARFLSDALD